MRMEFLPREVLSSEAINDQEHGPLVKIAIACSITCSLLFLSARLMIRWPWKDRFGKDDAATAIATLLSIVQGITTCAAIYRGLGHLSQAPLQVGVTAAKKLTYASDLLFVCAIFLGRSAVALLFSRLSISRTHSAYSLALVCACGVSGVVSLVIVATAKHAPAPWSYAPVNASSTLARWIAVEAMGGLLDVCIVAFSITLVSGLQMPTNTKLKVVIGVGLRMPLVAIAVLRLISLSQSLESDIFLFDYATTELYTQAEMGYNIICATLPCFNIILQAANTGLLGDNKIITTKATRGSSGVRTIGSKNEPIELTSRNYGKYAARASAGSVASESSRKAIVVSHTVNVRHEL